MNGLLTVKEVTKKLGIQKCAVYRRVKKGTLNCVRQPGGKRLWFDKIYIDNLTR